MFVTKTSKIKGDLYKIHQHVSAMFPNQRRMFYVGDSDITVVSETSALFSETSKVVSEYNNGAILPFRVRLNPVKAEKATGRRIPISRDNLSAFVMKRLTHDAFTLKECKVTIEGRYILNKGSKTIPYESVVVEGVLEVLDSSKFADVLISGLPGKGKAFGFSMLNIF